MQEKPLKIGIAGLGTVGAGVFRIISEKQSLLEKRSGRKIEVAAVSSRIKSKDRGINLTGVTWYDNVEHLASDPDIELVVELIGGSEGPAYEVCTRAIKNKKHVVTANKALISHHGVELANMAEKSGVNLAFEAAVAGGIPVIKTITEGLSANKIISLAGILNGTCNFILTKMQDEKADFKTVLKEAQELGYAEADPSFDIDGVDAAHKLSILSSLSFGTPPNFDSIYIDGIRKIELTDIEYAKELGYAIKLLGIASIIENEGKEEIQQRVHPCLIPLDSILAKTSGVLNGILIESDVLGKLFLEGPGAGSGPTASAVVADIIDIASGRFRAPFSTKIKHLAKSKDAKMDYHQGAYYLRLVVSDKPGVVAEIAEIFKEKKISLNSLLQKPAKHDSSAEIVITTHQAMEDLVMKALADLEKLENIIKPIRIIRIEEI